MINENKIKCKEEPTIKAHKFRLNIVNISVIISLLMIIVFSVYGYKAGIFRSSASFDHFIQGFGIWAVVIFILVQAISVILSFLPTSIGCIGGVIIFGPWFGFLYNYIGICIGSIAAFLLSKHYGSSMVQKIIGKKLYEKYITWASKGNKFDKTFAFAIFFPVAPDDILCYIAGLTNMTFLRFFIIIILGKPVSLAAYSIGLSAILHYASKLL